MDVRALADEDLIPLMARGEARAFEAVYERHSGAAYSLAYRMVGTRALDRTDGATKVLIHRAIRQLEDIVQADANGTSSNS